MRSAVVISIHEKGFWQADYYAETPEDWSDEWPVPDGYCTGRVGSTESDIRAKAGTIRPGVEIVYANDGDADT